MRTFDPWFHQLVESATLSCYKNRSKFCSYNSAVVTLSSDDLLRLVPLFMWMRNSLSDGDVLMKRILSEILKKGSETPGDVADVGSVQVEENVGRENTIVSQCRSGRKRRIPKRFRVEEEEDTNVWGKDDDDWMEVSVIQRSPHSNPPCVASTPISTPVIPSAFVETVTISNESEVIRFQSALKSSSELLLKLGS